MIDLTQELAPHLRETLTRIVEEATKTKPSHYTLRQAVALLIMERYERMILTRDEAIRLFAFALSKESAL